MSEQITEYENTVSSTEPAEDVLKSLMNEDKKAELKEKINNFKNLLGKLESQFKKHGQATEISLEQAKKWLDLVNSAGANLRDNIIAQSNIMSIEKTQGKEQFLENLNLMYTTFLEELSNFKPYLVNQKIKESNQQIEEAEVLE